MGSFLEEFFPDVYRRMKGDVRVSNYCKFDSQLLTLFTSSLYIAGLLTAMLLSSWFTATHGRRPSMIIGGAAPSTFTWPSWAERSSEWASGSRIRSELSTTNSPESDDEIR